MLFIFERFFAIKCLKENIGVSSFFSYVVMWGGWGVGKKFAIGINWRINLKMLKI